MALDKLVDSAQLDADLESVADAIREKGGTSEALSFPSGFVTAIAAIQTGGGNLTTKTVTPSDNTLFITKDTEVGYLTYTVSVTSHTAGSNAAVTMSILDLTVDKEYAIVGKITVIGTNNVVLEYYDINSTFVWKTTNYAKIVENNENAYYSSFTFGKATASSNQCKTNFVYQKSGQYGFKIEASICEISSYDGLSVVTVTPQKYSSEFVKGYIGRTSILKDIEWPDGIIQIGKYAFAECRYFNPSSLPNTIKYIYDYAFYNCTALQLTSLPNSITIISDSTFSGCGALRLTSLPDTLTVINQYAFSDCTYMPLASLPSGLTSIYTRAFGGCENMTISSLPSGLEILAGYAFYNCKKITISSIPSSITSKQLQSAVFMKCVGITSMTIPSGFTAIGDSMFSYCTNLASISLPDTITKINSGAFLNCESLLTVECNGRITTLGSSSFLSDSSSYTMQLQSARFPNMALTSNISTVFGSSSAALACHFLEFVDIGTTTGIASNAFANCYSLETIVLRKTSVCTLANVNAFLNTPLRGYDNKTATVYVPSNLIANYKTATNWSTLYNAGTITFEAIEGSDYELD